LACNLLSALIALCSFVTAEKSDSSYSQIGISAFLSCWLSRPPDIVMSFFLKNRQIAGQGHFKKQDKLFSAKGKPETLAWSMI
jgi:hypothetical protein